jgi:hypothetical protein
MQYEDWYEIGTANMMGQESADGAVANSATA